MGNCLKKILGYFQPDKIYHIEGKRLKQLQLLAEGGYGYVLLVMDVDSKKHYALKKQICQNAEQKQHYQREVAIMKDLSHCKHIIEFYGDYQIERQEFLEGYILMELGSKTVYDFLKEKEQSQKWVVEKEILTILIHTAKGLKEMHAKGYIHQDVKIENILILPDFTAKLCDFGSCSKLKIDLATVSKAQMYKYEQIFQKNTTLMYRPPEMIDLYLKYPINEKIDIWMLGCVVYVLCFGMHPFQEEGKLSIVNANVKYSNSGGQTPMKPISSKMEDFIRHMLTPNPLFRPSIDEVLEIAENWDRIESIRLNKVAQLIKDDEALMHQGKYDQMSKGEWRNLRL